MKPKLNGMPSKRYKGLLAFVGLATLTTLASLRPLLLEQQQSDLAALRSALINGSSTMCTALQDACLDQGSIVLFPPGGVEALNNSERLPPFPKMHVGWKPFIVPNFPDTVDNIAHGKVGYIKLPDIRWAAHESAEPAHLQRPHFSSTHLPVIVFPFVLFNFARTPEHLGGWLYNATRAYRSRSVIQLLVKTPEGLGLPAFTQQMLGTLGFHSVRSLADASNRGPDGACYRELFVCPSSSVVNVVQFSQHVVSQLQTPASRRLARDMHAHQRLNVVLSNRNTTTRKVLNGQQLLQQCHGDRVEAGGQQWDLHCTAAGLNGLQASIAALQRADVFIGVHGAGMANAWFMPPGSTVIEVLPFNAQRFPYSEITADDPASRLRWFNIFVCSPEFSAPSIYEEGKLQPSSRWTMDRHVSVPWAAVKQVLVESLQMRSHEEYVAAHRANRNSFYLTAGGALEAAGPAHPRFACPEPPNATHVTHEQVLHGNTVRYALPSRGPPRFALVAFAACREWPAQADWQQLQAASLELDNALIQITPLDFNSTECWELAEDPHESMQLSSARAALIKLWRRDDLKRVPMILLGGPVALMATVPLKPTGTVFLPGETYNTTLLEAWVNNTSFYPPTAVVRRQGDAAAEVDAQHALTTLGKAKVPLGDVQLRTEKQWGDEMPVVMTWLYDMAYDTYAAVRRRMRP